MLIVVDENDNQIGECEKMETHEKWLLHRAFSLLIYNKKWELLIQKRADCKYHSPWKWANTCCSHPNNWELIENAIHRRLDEELWFDTNMLKKTEFIYNSDVWMWLTEHEYLHVYEWVYDDVVIPNPEEVSDYKWVSIDFIKDDMNKNPDSYSTRFLIMFENHFDKLFK